MTDELGFDTPTDEPDRKPCPDCGREMTWLADGSRPRAHKCQPEQPHTGVTVDRVIEAFVKTRDELAALKKEYEARAADAKDLQDRRANWLKTKMDVLGVTQLKGIHGSVFVDYKDSATVSDGESFKAWCHADWENRSFFLANSVNKTAVKQALDDGQPPPPGVNYTKIKDVKVRRA